MSKKTMHIVCLTLWSVCLVMAIIGAIFDIKFHAATCIFPEVICVMHYIGEIRRGE